MRSLEVNTLLRTNSDSQGQSIKSSNVIVVHDTNGKGTCMCAPAFMRMQQFAQLHYYYALHLKISELISSDIIKATVIPQTC